MAQVTVSIDGKPYRMACEEGQEEHLLDLANQFDRYVGHLKSQFGEIGDLRVTVMAGIMVMDELAELKRRLSTYETSSVGAANREEALVGAILDLTEQLNGVTRKLMAKPENPTS